MPWLRHLPAFLCALAVLCAAAHGGAQEASCPPGNLLDNRSAVPTSRGATRAEAATDGWHTPEGHAADTPDAALIKADGYLQWDLGHLHKMVAATIQSDNNDTYRISVSNDGETFATVWTLDKVDQAGLHEQWAKGFTAIGRYVRIESPSGDAVRAISEARIYCQPPDPWPPVRAIRKVVTQEPDASRLAQIQSFKIVLGLGVIALLLWLLPHLRRRARTITGLSIAALSLATWLHFGLFHDGKTVVHHWDAFHYFIGSKYFPELGYFELYRCTAAAQRESGQHADLDQTGIRDLDDNRVYPGTWSRTHEGRCRADFSPRRWKQFVADLERFRKLMKSRPLVHSLGDHGFNATPLNVAWLRLFTAATTPSDGTLTAIAAVDMVTLGLVLVLLFWGFGPVGCAVGAAVLAVGFPWGYHWVGGGVLRHSWLLAAAASLALFKKQRPAAGAACLTVAGLLRLFPFVFLGALGLYMLVRALRSRRILPEDRQVVLSATLTLALGFSAAGMVNGFASNSDFARVMERHSDTPLANHMGLSTVLGFRFGQSIQTLSDASLSEPHDPWKKRQLLNRKDNRPLWALSILLSLALIVAGAARGVPLWQAPSLGGPLLFAALPMTSYDYIWLILLIPLVLDNAKRSAALVGFVTFLQATAIFQPDLESRHYVYSFGCLLFLIWLVRDLILDWQRAPEAESA
ncbi:MAG: discoidin domain-containing protein [Myxococcales bacterium]|nr:discoidin domain-containing protein [Myxococcales bacterium]